MNSLLPDSILFVMVSFVFCKLLSLSKTSLVQYLLANRNICLADENGSLFKGLHVRNVNSIYVFILLKFLKGQFWSLSPGYTVFRIFLELLIFRQTQILTYGAALHFVLRVGWINSITSAQICILPFLMNLGSF